MHAALERAVLRQQLICHIKLHCFQLITGTPAILTGMPSFTFLFSLSVRLWDGTRELLGEGRKKNNLSASVPPSLFLRNLGLRAARHVKKKATITEPPSSNYRILILWFKHGMTKHVCTSLPSFLFPSLGQVHPLWSHLFRTSTAVHLLPFLTLHPRVSNPLPTFSGQGALFLEVTKYITPTARDITATSLLLSCYREPLIPEE